MNEPEIELSVNGRPVRLARTPDRPLLFALRYELGLMGTKYGCGEGQCGSCTVLVDGSAVHSCQVMVDELGGRDVTTIEGLSTNGTPGPVQRAFAEVGAFQCGYCTPGMIVRATALLASRPSPTRDEIATALEGNLCRCGGYLRILLAVERAAQLVRQASPAT